MTTEEITTVLQVFSESIKFRGLSATIKLLSVPVSENSDINIDKYEELIFSLVETHFGIKKENLLNSRYAHGDMKYAIGMCVYFISEKKHLGEIRRSIFKNKTKVLLGKYRSLITSLSVKSKVDKRIYEIRETIRTAIESFEVKKNK